MELQEGLEADPKGVGALLVAEGTVEAVMAGVQEVGAAVEGMEADTVVVQAVVVKVGGVVVAVVVEARWGRAVAVARWRLWRRRGTWRRRRWRGWRRQWWWA